METKEHLLVGAIAVLCYACAYNQVPPAQYRHLALRYAQLAGISLEETFRLINHYHDLWCPHHN